MGGERRRNSADETGQALYGLPPNMARFPLPRVALPVYAAMHANPKIGNVAYLRLQHTAHDRNAAGRNTIFVSGYKPVSFNRGFQGQPGSPLPRLDVSTRRSYVHPPRDGTYAILPFLFNYTVTLLSYVRYSTDLPLWRLPALYVRQISGGMKSDV